MKILDHIIFSDLFKIILKLLSFVQKELKAGHPIMVENVFMGGHWRVIIGYDTMGTQTIADDVLIFAEISNN